MPLGFSRAVFMGGGAPNETVITFSGLSTGSTNNGQLFLNDITVIKDDLGVAAGSEHFAEQTASQTYKVSNVASDVGQNARDNGYIPIKAGTYEFEITSITGTFRHAVQEAYSFNIRIDAGIALTTSGNSSIGTDSPTRNITIPVTKATEADDLSTLTGAGTLGDIPNGTNFTNAPFSSAQPISSLPLVMGDVVLGGPATNVSGVSSINYVGNDTASFRENLGLAVTFNVNAATGIQTAGGTVRITLRNT